MVKGCRRAYGWWCRTHLRDMEVCAAITKERAACARLAEQPYSDEVRAVGGRKGDEPLAVGKKIARAIRGRA